MNIARYRPDSITAHVERTVLGADYGGDGYTTLEQVDMLARLLQLRPGTRLLDIGSGHGRPGTYLASTTGCDVVLTDFTPEGLRAAADRAVHDGISHRCVVAAADGERLPFPTASFDAVVHTDVLCCLPAKLAVLSETRRVLRPRGRTGCYAIFVTPSLGDRDYHRAVRCGPAAVATPGGCDYRSLLSEAGYTEIDEVDVTDAYLATARNWLRLQRRHAHELSVVEPPGTFDDRLAYRQAAVDAIEAGLLRRSLFTATRPLATTVSDHSA